MDLVEQMYRCGEVEDEMHFVFNVIEAVSEEKMKLLSHMISVDGW